MIVGVGVATNDESFIDDSSTIVPVKPEGIVKK
jgi:hypothetical protein